MEGALMFLGGFSLTHVAFGVFAALCLGGALSMMTRKNLVSAAMSLVVCFVGISGLYALLSAHFLSVVQVLVYAGGIMVLFVFVIMLLNQEEIEPFWVKDAWLKALLLGALGYLFVRLALIIYFSTKASCVADFGQEACAPVSFAELPVDFGSVKAMGTMFLREYLFLFEAVSLVLIVAVLGAVVIARSRVAKSTSAYEVAQKQEVKEVAT